ncbi:MAG: deoxyribonuclease IV [Chitinispirillales bacterium]|nr:deoxyribonuclease IV [Chitinispirillales bacterium]
MKYIGPHVSASGGVHNAPLNAKKLNATGFGLFTKNQRRWESKPLAAAEIDSFKKNMELCGYPPQSVLAHDSYLINIANPNPDIRKKSTNALIDEAQRCSVLGLPLLNIHPGSHLDATLEEGLSHIAESVNNVLNITNGVTIVLEAMAGQGTNIGGRFEHLAAVIDKVEDKTRVGICLDTCHIFAAGYDIRDTESYAETMREFGRVIGFNYLRGLHLNDAKAKLASHLDRHESIGKGTLGTEAFRLFLQDTRFDKIPCVLETPGEELWPAEVELLKSLEMR